MDTNDIAIEKFYLFLCSYFNTTHDAYGLCMRSLESNRIAYQPELVKKTLLI